MTIYGIISFIIGLYATVINGLEVGLTLKILNIFSSSMTIISGSTCGVVSILSPIVLGILQSSKKIRFFVGLPLLIICFYLLIKEGHNYLQFGNTGGAIYIIFYIIIGLPFTAILFIIPLFILAILDCKHKLVPPKEIIKNSFIKLFFIIYTIICISIIGLIIV